MIRVLHVLNSINPSGAEIMLEHAEPHWKKMNIQSDILATGPVLGSYASQMENVGFKIFYIPFSFSRAFGKKLSGFLKTERYDIIHIHSEQVSLYTAFIARTSGNKVIIRTVHHIWPYTNIRTFLRTFVFRFLVNKVLRVQAVSNSISGQQNELKLYKAKNLLIPNWYNEAIFSLPSAEEKRRYRIKYDIPQEKKVFVTLGGNWPYKNYHLIIEALSKFTKREDILYIQIGKQQDDKPLHRLASDLDVEHLIKFMGVVKDASELLKAGDFYLMPSREEGFGNAAVEAMAVGLIPILSDVRALSDFRHYADKIFWINPTAQELAKKMDEVLQLEESQIDDYRRGLSKAMKENFGVSVGGVAYGNLYKKMYKGINNGEVAMSK